VSSFQFAGDITRLIRDGVGIAVLPQVVVQEYLEKGELRVLDVDARLPPLHFHVAFATIPACAAGADRRYGGGSRGRFHAELAPAAEVRGMPFDLRLPGTLFSTIPPGAGQHPAQSLTFDPECELD